VKKLTERQESNEERAVRETVARIVNNGFPYPDYDAGQRYATKLQEPLRSVAWGTISDIWRTHDHDHNAVYYAGMMQEPGKTEKLVEIVEYLRAKQILHWNSTSCGGEGSAEIVLRACCDMSGEERTRQLTVLYNEFVRDRIYLADVAKEAISRPNTVYRSGGYGLGER
jgi:hypothetical protein